MVRNEKGEELTCPSLSDLHALYRQGFVADDDLVRQERAERWTRIGDFPPLQGERGRRATLTAGAAVAGARRGRAPSRVVALARARQPRAAPASGRRDGRP